ncbi:MAG: DeoR/GlpR family DNA-binding transcription regulator [Armatimonadota bacterium]
MKKKDNPQKGMIAAERRRKIYEIALKDGSVTVGNLAGLLSVAENTVRNDLDILHTEGKLIRSHGGAVVTESSSFTMPYTQTREAHIEEKAKIGEAAVSMIPSTGSIFINAGSTTYQMVIRMPKSPSLHVTTNSPEIALYLTSNMICKVDLIGGCMVQESLETDGSLADDILENLYWESCFLGVSAIDAARGITSINMQIALLEKRVMDHSEKVVILCDSSKFNRFSRAKAGAISMINVLVTDSSADETFIQELSTFGTKTILV